MGLSQVLLVLQYQFILQYEGGHCTPLHSGSTTSTAPFQGPRCMETPSSSELQLYLCRNFSQVYSTSDYITSTEY
jgi:hypothetical protein